MRDAEGGKKGAGEQAKRSAESAAVDVTKPPGTYQFNAVVGRSMSGEPASLENASTRAAREMSRYT